MSQNFVSPGKALVVAAPYALGSGDGCKVGALFGVACDDALIGADVVIDTEGVHELVKVGSQAWAVGERIYWDDGNTRCTTDSAAGMFIGCAVEAVASGAGDTIGKVKLASASENPEGAQGAIVALTDSTGGSGSHDDTLAAAAPDVITAYSAHASGGTTVTSNAATDLDTTAAGLATAVTELTALRATVAVVNQNCSDLAQKLNEVLAKLVLAGVIDAA